MKIQVGVVGRANSPLCADADELIGAIRELGIEAERKPLIELGGPNELLQLYFAAGEWAQTAVLLVVGGFLQHVAGEDVYKPVWNYCKALAGADIAERGGQTGKRHRQALAEQLPVIKGQLGALLTEHPLRWIRVLQAAANRGASVSAAIPVPWNHRRGAAMALNTDDPVQTVLQVLTFARLAPVISRLLESRHFRAEQGGMIQVGSEESEACAVQLIGEGDFGIKVDAQYVFDDAGRERMHAFDMLLTP